MENIAGAAAGRRTKVKSVMGCTGNKTFLSFLQQVSALLARPAGQQFCSHGCGVLIRLLEMPCSALPFEEVLEKEIVKETVLCIKWAKDQKSLASMRNFSTEPCTYISTQMCVYMIV